MRRQQSNKTTTSSSNTSLQNTASTSSTTAGSLLESKDMSRLTGSKDNITIWNAATLQQRRKQSPQTFTILSAIIDELGAASAKVCRHHIWLMITNNTYFYLV